jgi:hypothetical protein
MGADKRKKEHSPRKLPRHGSMMNPRCAATQLMSQLFENHGEATARKA